MAAKKGYSIRMDDRTVRLLDEMAKDKRTDRTTIINAVLKKYTESYAERKYATKKREAVQE